MDKKMRAMADKDNALRAMIKESIIVEHDDDIAIIIIPGYAALEFQKHWHQDLYELNAVLVDNTYDHEIGVCIDVASDILRKVCEKKYPWLVEQEEG